MLRAPGVKPAMECAPWKTFFSLSFWMIRSPVNLKVVFHMDLFRERPVSATWCPGSAIAIIGPRLLSNSRGPGDHVVANVTTGCG